MGTILPCLEHPKVSEYSGIIERRSLSLKLGTFAHGTLPIRPWMLDVSMPANSRKSNFRSVSLIIAHSDVER